ncbi:ImmA/IrrE family metallo-endopeptidase [Acinetobacter variabilis]|uniref:ImmA/IrrE family metallo-endopeptidase n=1 Tax=Acinetobacter variabilis TaxID=70346 RepID=UPI0028AF8A08|nr:XRE family transcriptional regulator [Acinetobacter variabilis]
MYQLDRIKAAQNLRGFSHSKTAEALDIPLATFKKYLSGERTLPYDFWQKVSKIFNVPESYFKDKNSTIFNMSEVNFRARARIKASYSNAIAEYIRLAESISDYFSRNIKNLPVFNILDDYNLDPDSEDSPEITALRIRSEWGLGVQPINNIISLLELKGIKVFSLPLNVREVDVLSISLDGQPFVLLDTFKSAERTRFDAAHELAHIFLHIYDTQTPNDEIDYKKRESEADRFASCFLMPDESFLSLAPKEMSINNMLKYKSYWRVSLQAINYKSHKLDLLSDWVYRSNCMKINSLGYHKNEPSPTHHDHSVLHLKLLKLLDAKGGFSVNSMLDEIGISREDFNNLTFNSLDAFTEYKDSKKPKLRIVQ